MSHVDMNRIESILNKDHDAQVQMAWLRAHDDYEDSAGIQAEYGERERNVLIELHEAVADEIRTNLSNWDRASKLFKVTVAQCVKREDTDLDFVSDLGGTLVMDAFLDWKTEHPMS